MGGDMKFTCPGCGKMLKVADGMAGKKGRCPACKGIVTIPVSAGSDSRRSAQKSPAPPPLPTPGHIFHLEEENRKKTKWQLSLFKERMILQSQETHASLTIFRDDAADKIKMSRLYVVPPLLLIKDSETKLNFRIKSEEYDILSEWVGKGALLKTTLKQRLGYCIPIGILYLWASLPVSGDPASSLAPIPFDPISFGLGIILILISILAKIWPHPALFLLDSGWFFLLMCYTIMQILTGSSLYWGILVLLYIIVMVSGILHYRNFASVRVT